MRERRIASSDIFKDFSRFVLLKGILDCEHEGILTE